MELKIKLLVADDHPQVLEGLLSLVSEPSRVTSLSADGSSLPVPEDGRSADTQDNNSSVAAQHRIALEVVVVRKQLLDAIGNIAKGGKNGGPSSNLDAYALATSSASRPALSPRERDVLLLIAGGMATKEVAFALNISPKTVDFHRDNIKKKIGLRSAAHLTRYAIENGWA